MMNKIGVGGGTDTSQINGNDGTLKAKVDAENKNTNGARCGIYKTKL